MGFPFVSRNMVRPIALLALQHFVAPFASATRFEHFGVGATPYVHGYFPQETSILKPTPPPQALQRLVKRDVATCGYFVSDGSPNICSSQQYCTTSASGSYGIWNCCNRSSCYTQTACSAFANWSVVFNYSKTGGRLTGL